MVVLSFKGRWYCPSCGPHCFAAPPQGSVPPAPNFNRVNQSSNLGACSCSALAACNRSSTCVGTMPIDGWNACSDANSELLFAEAKGRCPGSACSKLAGKSPLPG
mmetsp:Transcript_1598/g.5120  ORF Transcript_1598/g.5120 Transcript_1598/m.5120 type:complete len:105 (+) Transcript_1598:224-538(+)